MYSGVDVDGRFLVGDLAPVDLGALPRPQLDFAVGLEAGGGGDADQQHDHADVDDVAAVTAPVAGDDRQQGRRHRAAGELAPGGGAAPELLREAGQREAGEDEERQRPGLAAGVAEQQQGDKGDGGDHKRQAEDALRRGPADPAPGEQRPDPGEEDDQDRQRRRVAVEPGRRQRGLVAGEQFRDQREEGAPEDDHGERDEQQVVDQEDGLARDQRVDSLLGAQVVEAGDDQRRRAEHDDGDQAEDVGADGVVAEGMDRLQDAGADQERAQQRQREGGDDEAGVPDLQHPALLLDDDRVQEGGADQPRHQGGVLDRIPGPVAAPAELRVGPAGAEQEAEAEEGPGDQGEAAGGADPLGVDAAGDERADREGEGDREGDVPRVEHRWVDHHARVLQQRVEADAVGRHGAQRREGVDFGREQHQASEEGGDAHHHRGRPGDDLAQPVAGRVEGGAGGDREHPGPEQQRALLARPHRRQLVEGRGLDGRVLGDEAEAEVVAGEGDLDDHDAAGEQQEDARRRRGGRGLSSGGRRCARRWRGRRR